VGFGALFAAILALGAPSGGLWSEQYASSRLAGFGGWRVPGGAVRDDTFPARCQGKAPRAAIAGRVFRSFRCSFRWQRIGWGLSPDPPPKACRGTLVPLDRYRFVLRHVSCRRRAVLRLAKPS
jgi:hypothetical protein